MVWDVYEVGLLFDLKEVVSGRKKNIGSSEKQHFPRTARPLASVNALIVRKQKMMGIVVV